MLRTRLEKFINDYKKDIDSSADELLDKQMPVITEDLFGEFEKTGNRVRYENVYFTRRKFLAVLGMKALLEEPSERYSAVLSKLAEVMLDICSEECWALPAHINRRADPDWRLTVDLFASETAQTLAELTDRLDVRLPENVRNTVKNNIEKRVFQPFFTSKVPYAGWEEADHNWNAVCSGSIGSACLHLMRDDPNRLSECLVRICNALQFYIRGFADDGACMEGLGYYTYGMTFFSNFAQEIYDYTNGETDLFTGFLTKTDSRRMGKIASFPAKCFFTDGTSASFSDCGSHETFRVGLSSVLAAHLGRSGEHIMEDEEFFPNMDSAAGIHSDPCYRFAGLKMDLFYTQRYMSVMRDKSSADKIAGPYCLPSAQWYIANSETGVGFACKGGNNAEPHNHNDVGSFIYEAEQIAFLADLGAGEYTGDYFGGGRYNILCNSSLGHSVPIVNGQGQCAGKQYAADSFYIVQDDRHGIVKMGAASAYPKGLLKYFNRAFDFDRKTGKLHISDTFEFPERSGDTQVTENLITQVPPVVKGNRVVLLSGDAECVIEIESCEADITVKIKPHNNHRGETETVYAVQWDVPCVNGSAESNFKIWHTK